MAFSAPTFGSPFGAASPAPASASAFGTPSAFGAASTSAFGTTPAPAFGAAASQPAFSFNTAQQTPSPFGTPAPAAASSPFGATPFGANATPNVFGAAGTPSLFGAASTPFGAAASTPSLFGAASTPAASSPFGFGGTTPTGGGLFGAQTTSTMFGAQSAPGLFGAQQAASSIFGPAAIPQPTTAPYGVMPSAATAQTDSLVKELTEIKAAYTPGNPQYRFQYLLLNVVDNPAARVKPSNIDELKWRQALAAAGGPDNPDRLWPVPANGFKDLVARSNAQTAAIAENAARLKALQDLGFKLAKRQGGDLKQRAQEIQRKHQLLSSQLLHCVRLLDSLESRLAASVGYRSDVSRAKEDKLSRQLAGVEAELAPGSVTGLVRRLNTVAHNAQILSVNPVASAAAQTKLDERSSASLLSVLKDHADGIAKLQALLKRDLQDIAIIRHEMGTEDTGMGVPGIMGVD